MNDRDHFAAAALTGLLAGGVQFRGDEERDKFCAAAWALADAMLTARGDKPSAPAADARFDDGPGCGWRYLVPGEKREAGDQFRSVANREWRPAWNVGQFVEHDKDREYRRRVTTDHDAAPAATANAESVAPLPTATDGSGNPTSHGTGDISTPGLTSVEQFVLLEVRDRYADEDDIKSNEIAFVLDALLARLGGGR